jgi:hypothetical protein
MTKLLATIILLLCGTTASAQPPSLGEYFPDYIGRTQLEYREVNDDPDHAHHRLMHLSKVKHKGAIGTLQIGLDTGWKVGQWRFLVRKSTRPTFERWLKDIRKSGAKCNVPSKGGNGIPPSPPDFFQCRNGNVSYTLMFLASDGSLMIEEEFESLTPQK